MRFFPAPVSVFMKINFNPYYQTHASCAIVAVAVYKIYFISCCTETQDSPLVVTLTLMKCVAFPVILSGFPGS